MRRSVRSSPSGFVRSVSPTREYSQITGGGTRSRGLQRAVCQRKYLMKSRDIVIYLLLDAMGGKLWRTWLRRCKNPLDTSSIEYAFSQNRRKGRQRYPVRQPQC